MPCGIVILIEAATSLEFRAERSQNHYLGSHTCTRSKAERPPLIADPSVQSYLSLLREFGRQPTCHRNHTSANAADRLDRGQALLSHAAVADGNDDVAGHDLT